MALDDNMIDTITYKQWVSVDRSTLDTFTSTFDEFVELLCEKLERLIPHSFIAIQQASLVIANLASGQEKCSFRLTSLKTIPLCSKMQHRGFIGITHKQQCTRLSYTTNILERNDT